VKLYVVIDNEDIALKAWYDNVKLDVVIDNDQTRKNIYNELGTSFMGSCQNHQPCH
jgi:hypothetical protein